MSLLYAERNRPLVNASLGAKMNKTRVQKKKGGKRERKKKERQIYMEILRTNIAFCVTWKLSDILKLYFV